MHPTPRGEFRTGDGVVTVTTSIGIALGHGLTSTPDLRLKRADSALCAAKGHGRDTLEIAIRAADDACVTAGGREAHGKMPDALDSGT